MKKSSRPVSLGIDTSAYTTSIALYLEDGETVFEKKVLDVPEGQKGLRQSVAVFQHIHNLPVLFSTISENYDLRSLEVIGVSVSPRPLEDSYMPVFEVGKAFAQTLSATLKVPLLEVSHQENHIRAVLQENGLIKDPFGSDFLGIHFSGGTSEILMIHPTSKGYETKILSQSLDLKAGQLIDRVGLRFGLGFPAGMELEKMAQKAKGTISIPTRLTDSDFHFSGQENYVDSLIDKGYPSEEIASALFRMIAKTLERSIRRLAEEYDFNEIIFSGGVMSNTMIKEQLIKKLGPAGFRLYFSSPAHSSDNAVGNAVLAYEFLESNRYGS